jgi:phosphoribosylformimino-5-aminoimidazole carboxamide ribotide isomerase
MGTSAMHDPSLVHKALELNHEALVVFLDVKDGRVVSQEWVQDPKATVAEIAGAIRDAGVRHFIYQDVTADAAGHGPRAGEASSVAAEGSDVIVTGGVTSLEHIKEVASVSGVHGVLVGKPLMMGAFTYQEAVAAANEGVAARS